MKLCILGGGGFRTPYVYQALLRDHREPRITEVALYDVDAAHLATMAAILRRLGAEFADAPPVTSTGDLRAALAGSDFVFAAVRIGGLAGRCSDERVALDLGVLGQETTGPGGIAYALRTVPFMLDVARTVREVAPDAYLINFTNPAGIVTEAMQSVLGDRVFGICDTPSELGRRLATTLHADPDRIRLDYVGLNHLGWMRRVLVDDVDVLPRLLDDDAALDSLEETALFGRDWLRTIGSIPNEYLYYYYNNREAVRRIRDAPCTRGESLLRSQREFFAAAGADEAGAVSLWRAAVAERSAGYMAEAKGGEPGTSAHSARPEEDPAQQGYAGVAVRVMAAISRNERATVILNVRNGAAVAGMPEDAVIEVPTTVDADGVHALTPSAPDLHQLGLMQQVKDVERHAIRAALTGDRGDALQAFALHPLVDSVDVARRLLAGYIDAVPEIAAVFGGTGPTRGQRSNTVTSRA